MTLFKSISGNKEEPIKSYEDFWNWFQQHERTFFNAIKNNKNIEKIFFDKLSPKLNELKDGWILKAEIKYDGKENNGMPDDETYQFLNTIDEEILNELKDYEGYLNIGRQTSDGVREIYYACKDFRKPSKVLSNLITKYYKLDISYDIFKDKYWRSFDRFIQN